MLQTHGRIGELLVELELVKRGWSVQRLDSNGFAPNADLLAIKNSALCVIQVKSTDASNVNFGSVTAFLTDGQPIFNRVSDSPIQATHVICVSQRSTSPKYFVFSIADAEAEARRNAADYHASPTRSGAARSKVGYAKESFAKLAAYQDAWHRLEGA